MQRQAYSNSQNHTGRPLRTILQRTFLSPCYQGKACSQALDVPLPIAPCTCTGPSAGPAVCRGPCVPSELFLVVQVSGQKKSLHQTRCPAAPERRATEWLRLSIPQHLTVPLKRNFPIGTQQPSQPLLTIILQRTFLRWKRIYSSSTSIPQPASLSPCLQLPHHFSFQC